MIQNTWTWVAATATTGWHTFLNANSVVDYQIKIWDPGKTFQIKICNPGKTNVRCPSMWTSRTCLRIRECLLEVQVGFMISRHCWWSCIVHPIQATTVLTGLRFFSADHSAPSSSPSTSPPPCLSWWAGSPSSSHLWASPSFSTYLYPFNCNLWLHRYKSPSKRWTCCDINLSRGHSCIDTSTTTPAQPFPLNFCWKKFW